MMFRILVASAAALAAPVFAQTEFLGLGLDGRLRGLSADGRVAVGVQFNGSASRGAVWTREGGWSFVAPPQGYTNLAFADVSADGSVKVGTVRSISDSLFGLRYSESGYQILDDVTPFPTQASAVNVSRDGRVVVGTGRDGLRNRAVSWIGSPVPIPFGPISSSGGVANEDGTRIFGAYSSSTQIFSWTEAGGVTILGPYMFGVTFPNATSDDGRIVVGGSRGWRWIEGHGIEFLPLLPGGALPGTAYALSADGGVAAGGGPSGAYLWSEVTGTVYLSDVLAEQGVTLGGWRLSAVRDISADGRHLVGDGINPQGQPESWYAYLSQPLPAPGAVALLGLCGMVVTAGRRRRGRCVQDRDSRTPGALPRPLPERF